MSIQENTSELQSILEQVNNLPNANVEHNHDDLYYTKAESDERFDSKADAEHNHDSLYYTKTQSDELLAAKADEGHSHSEYRVKTYYAFNQINLTNGSETIESIATNLPSNSMMLVTIGAQNATIYPNQYGTLEVIKGGDATRVIFRFYQKTSGKTWYGAYDSSASTKWTGWTEIGNAEDYLPLDGSVDMTGAINIVNTDNYFAVSKTRNTSNASHKLTLGVEANGGTTLEHYKDSVLDGRLILNSGMFSGLTLAIQKNSSESAKQIFGEHNIDLLSSSLITTGAELTSGVSALGSGKIHLVLE